MVRPDAARVRGNGVRGVAYVHTCFRFCSCPFLFRDLGARSRRFAGCVRLGASRRGKKRVSRAYRSTAPSPFHRSVVEPVDFTTGSLPPRAPVRIRIIILAGKDVLFQAAGSQGRAEEVTGAWCMVLHNRALRANAAAMWKKKKRRRFRFSREVTSVESCAVGCPCTLAADVSR